MKILVLNCGSSSVKYKLIELDDNAQNVLAEGGVEKVGLPDSFLKFKYNGEKVTITTSMPNHNVAIRIILDNLTSAKYGCIKDAKFAEKLHDYILFKDVDNKYLTLKDCIEQNKKEDTAESDDTKKEDAENKENAEKKEPEKTTIFYVTDPVQQSQYINMFKEAGKNAVILSHNIDTTFISHLEQKDQTIQFKRIDADVTEELKGEGAADENTAKTLTELFRKNLNMEKLEVKAENLKNESVAAMMTLSEESRRMQDMMKMYNMYGMDPSMFGGNETLVLNVNNKLVQYILDHKDGEHVPMFCKQLYDLAMLSNQPLSPEAMTAFINRSNEVMMILADK